MATESKFASSHPVHSLREQCTEFEAALELTLAKPRRKAVHQLRTRTRRIEAHLALLCLLEPAAKSLTGLSRQARKVSKRLASVRKAAGKVRDLDVQRAIIKEAVADGATRTVRREAKHLRAALKTQRAKAADALVDDLQGYVLALGPKLEELLEQLEPARDLRVAPKRLITLVQSWYAACADLSGTSEKALHGVRKAAKLARYMAEIGDAKPAAEAFQALQQRGGTWHDALTLHRVAHQHLGKNSALVKAFASQEQVSLADFRSSLGLDAKA
jgi:CHAD domain-containing protein